VLLSDPVLGFAAFGSKTGAASSLIGKSRLMMTKSIICGETFRDGVAVVEMLMALYRSAETGSTVHLPDDGLETYVPPVARGSTTVDEAESGSPHTG
jgi:hypothetical protein